MLLCRFFLFTDLSSLAARIVPSSGPRRPLRRSARPGPAGDPRRAIRDPPRPVSSPVPGQVWHLTKGENFPSRIIRQRLDFEEQCRLCISRKRVYFPPGNFFSLSPPSPVSLKNENPKLYITSLVILLTLRNGIFYKGRGFRRRKINVEKGENGTIPSFFNNCCRNVCVSAMYINRFDSWSDPAADRLERSAGRSGPQRPEPRHVAGLRLWIMPHRIIAVLAPRTEGRVIGRRLRNGHTNTGMIHWKRSTFTIPKLALRPATALRCTASAALPHSRRGHPTRCR